MNDHSQFQEELQSKTVKNHFRILIIGNLAALVILLFICLGTMVDIKYEFDDPATHPTGADAAQYIYLLLIKLGVLTAIIIAFNVIFIIRLRKYCPAK